MLEIRGQPTRPLNRVGEPGSRSIRALRGWGGNNRSAIRALQFLVGGLVTFGGASFVLAVDSFGMALGLIHLTIGLVGALLPPSSL